MSVRTLPLRELTEAMARCVRETLLPAIEDPSARTQAETLAALLDGMPASFSADTAQAVRSDSDQARALLGELGALVPRPPGSEASLAEIVTDNHALHAALMELAARARADGDAARLRSLQEYFLASGRREHAPTEEGTDFASLSTKEDSARRES